MNKTNGQSSIAWKSGFKCSQGSETLIGTGVNYLLGQVTGQRKRTFPLIFQGRASPGNQLWAGAGAGDRRKPALVKAYKGAFLRRHHSSTVISQISDGNRPETYSRSLPGDHAHSLLFRYSARPGVGNRFGNAKHRELEHFKPVVSYCVTCFGHQALTLPRQSQPETAIVSFTSEQANCADQLVRGASQAKRPGPFISAFNGRQGDITIVRVTAIRWIRPRHHVSDVADDLPVWE
jgi:hypothetical protein